MEHHKPKEPLLPHRRFPDAAAAHVGGLKSYLVATGSHTVKALESETNDVDVFHNLYELGADVFNLELPT